MKGLAELTQSEMTSLPLLVVELSRVFLDQIDGLSKTIAKLEKATVQEATRGTTMRRLQTMPGVGPITAMAIETFAPPMAVFRRGRDFAAWLGLVPRQHSTGGKPLLGKISKMGQRDILLRVDYRRDGGRPLGLPKGRARGKLAASPAPGQATDVVGHRTRQQNGARDLGHADQGRRLSVSCRCNALIHDRTVQPRKRRARGEVDER